MQELFQVRPNNASLDNERLGYLLLLNILFDGAVGARFFLQNGQLAGELTLFPDCFGMLVF
jgi:hypothetical protein